MDRLQFKQKLSGCSNADLLKRLKTLHVELSEMDQETIQLDSLNNLAKELMSPTLMIHKEKGVRAYLGCALVDMLRLFAPEAPYTEAELKDIFEFLFAQLKHLTTAKEPHYSEYFYLLESFANVKSIVIICDLAASEELMTTFFKQSFDLISSESPKNVEIHLADILVQLIEETANLSPDVVDILLVQFLTKNAKLKPAAHQLAVEVCRGASDKLQRHVTAYFADVVDSSRKLEEDSDASEDDVKTTKAKTNSHKKITAPPPAFVTAHSLIRQLNRKVPSLLLNIIPLLESELAAPGDEYRLLATKTLGTMMGEKVGQGDVAKKYPKTWLSWLGRTSDKCVEVRVALTESLGKIWKEHAQELGGAVEKVMISKLLQDPDDKVRAAACNVFLTMDYETACHGTSVVVLANLGERTMDKKVNVRTVAFEALGRLYSLAFPQIESRDRSCIEHFGWIPTSIFQATLSADTAAHNSIRLAIEHTLYTQILPSPNFKDDEGLAPWVDRLLVVYQHLTEKGRKALLSFSRLADRRPGAFVAFVNACEQNNGGTIDEDNEKIKLALKQSIHFIAASLPDPNKTTDDLNKFAKANEKHLYKLLRTLMDPASDLKTIIKTQKEALRRIEMISPTIVETFKTIIHRCSYQLINKSSIPLLLKKIQHGATSNSQESKIQLSLSLDLLTYISKNRPILYTSHTAELLKVLGDGNDERLITASLHALSRMFKSDRESFPDKKIAERAKHFALKGNQPQAKYAATIVALDTSRPGSAEDVVAFIADSLELDSRENLVPYLSALTRLARFSPNAFETRSEVITTLIIKDVLVKSEDDVEVEEGVEWLTDSEIDNLAIARVLALKTLVNRCLAYTGEGEAAIEIIAAPVFVILFALLIKEDEEEARYSAPVSARLRLTSAISLLKLAAASPIYLRKVIAKFTMLAWISQDHCYEVRSEFIHRLCLYLRTGRLTSPRFNMILFLVAHDPEQDLISEARLHVKTRIRISPSQRRVNFENTFVRLIHLLAHHPDLSHEDDEHEMQLMAKYIDLYLECVASAENVPYIYHLALRLKTIRDLESDEFSNNLYILSELVQHIIKRKAALNNWPIPTYPEHTKLPADIFGSLPSATIAKQIADHVYLSQDLLNSVAPTKIVKTKPAKAKAVKKEKVATTPKPKATKRKSNGSTRTSAKRTKKEAKETWDSDKSEEEAEASSESDAEDSIDERGETLNSKKKAAKKVVQPTTTSNRAGLRRGVVSSSPSKEKKSSPVKKKIGKMSKVEIDSESEEMSE